MPARSRRYESATKGYGSDSAKVRSFGQNRASGSQRFFFAAFTHSQAKRVEVLSQEPRFKKRTWGTPIQIRVRSDIAKECGWDILERHEAIGANSLRRSIGRCCRCEGTIVVGEARGVAFADRGALGRDRFRIPGVGGASSLGKPGALDNGDFGKLLGL